jgi:hypothetical protein
MTHRAAMKKTFARIADAELEHARLRDSVSL